MRPLSIDQLERQQPTCLPCEYAAAFCRINFLLLQPTDPAAQLADLGMLGDREPVPLASLDLARRTQLPIASGDSPSRRELR